MFAYAEGHGQEPPEDAELPISRTISRVREIDNASGVLNPVLNPDLFPPPVEPPRMMFDVPPPAE
jgi:hypothetical protein